MTAGSIYHISIAARGWQLGQRTDVMTFWAQTQPSKYSTGLTLAYVILDPDEF